MGAEIEAQRPLNGFYRVPQSTPRRVTSLAPCQPWSAKIGLRERRPFRRQVQSRGESNDKNTCNSRQSQPCEQRRLIHI